MYSDWFKIYDYAGLIRKKEIVKKANFAVSISFTFSLDSQSQILDSANASELKESFENIDTCETKGELQAEIKRFFKTHVATDESYVFTTLSGDKVTVKIKNNLADEAAKEIRYIPADSIERAKDVAKRLVCSMNMVGELITDGVRKTDYFSNNDTRIKKGHEGKRCAYSEKTLHVSGYGDVTAILTIRYLSGMDTAHHISVEGMNGFKYRYLWLRGEYKYTGREFKIEGSVKEE